MPLESLTEEEQMQVLLGLSGEFSSTKGKPVESNHKDVAAQGAARTSKQIKYKQYMNKITRKKPDGDGGGGRAPPSFRR